MPSCRAPLHGTPAHTPVLACLAVLLTLTGCSSQPGPATPAAGRQAAQQPASAERLIAVTPTAWQRIYQINSDQVRISDFVPQGQVAANWSNKLSFESFAADELMTDPIAVLLSEAEGDEKRCTFVQHFNIYSGYENGFETSVRLFLCGENTFAGMGEVKLVKAIRGRSDYYFVRVIQRLAPFEPGQPDFAREVMAEWSGFLSTVFVCDDTPAHPCDVPRGQDTEDTNDR